MNMNGFYCEIEKNKLKRLVSGKTAPANIPFQTGQGWFSVLPQDLIHDTLYKILFIKIMHTTFGNAFAC